MCGRYTQTAASDKLAKRFKLASQNPEIARRYNIAPTQDAPVVANDDPKRLQLMRWGLIPVWAKEAAIGNRMINARAETVTEKPSFRKAFERRRCLVLADSFYEWRKMAGQAAKIPMRFALKDGEPFAFAGLYELWREPDGAEVRSFTIITTEANDLMRPVHDRMPVMLSREDELKWIDPSTTIDKAKGLLRPFAVDRMTCHAVSPLVNSPRNDSPDCIRPVA